MRKYLPHLVVVLFVAGIAALFLWPTPRRRALSRVEELNGIYREDHDTDGRRLAIVGFISQPVTDDELAMLRDIHPLHRVLLDGSKVTDAGLVHLIGIEGLEWVSVCNTAVTDAGMAHLAKIPTLTSVHVRRTRVSDAGLALLNGLPRLDLVSVGDCRITHTGVAALRRTTPTLRYVFFNDNANKIE